MELGEDMWLTARSAIKLVVDEAVHPICRHYTSSDRVHRDVMGARLLGLVRSMAC